MKVIKDSNVDSVYSSTSLKVPIYLSELKTAPLKGRLYFNSSSNSLQIGDGIKWSSIVTSDDINATSLQGTPISINSPLSNQVLLFNSGTGKWTPSSVTSTGSNAIELQGNSINSTTPLSNQSLVWDGTQWTPKSTVISIQSNGGTAETGDLKLINGTGISIVESPGGTFTFNIAGGGYLPLSGGTMTGPIAGFMDQNGQVYNVKAYGAAGTGFPVDDSIAINAAITAASSSPRGGIILFPPGVYYIASQIAIPYQNISLRGSNEFSPWVYPLGSTTIQFLSSFSVPVINITASNVAVTGITFAPVSGASTAYIVSATGTPTALQNITLSKLYGGNTGGVSFTHIGRSVIQDVELQGCGSVAGFSFVNCEIIYNSRTSIGPISVGTDLTSPCAFDYYGLNCFTIVFDDCTGEGAAVSGPTPFCSFYMKNVNDSACWNLGVNGAVQDQIYLENCTIFPFTNTFVGDVTTNAFHLVSCTNCVFSGGNIGNYTGNAFLIDASASPGFSANNLIEGFYIDYGLEAANPIFNITASPVWNLSMTNNIIHSHNSITPPNLVTDASTHSGRNMLYANNICSVNGGTIIVSSPIAAGYSWLASNNPGYNNGTVSLSSTGSTAIAAVNDTTAAKTYYPTMVPTSGSGTYPLDIDSAALNFIVNSGTSNSLNLGTSIAIGVVGSPAIDNSSSSIVIGANANAGSGLNGIFIGNNAGTSLTTGIQNIGIGSFALNHNTTGNNNSSLGYLSLFLNSIGNNNSAIGSNALNHNTTGNNNNAIGSISLFVNSTGNDNNAIGYQALRSNTTGNNNNAIGSISLFVNSTGNDNNAVGYQALRSNSVGNNNNAMGYNSLFYNSSGSNNCGVGHQALSNNGFITYSIGTASQSTTTITGISTNWTSAMVGGIIVWGANTAQAPITAFVSTTSLTSSLSQTVSPSDVYVIYFGPSTYTTGTVTGSGTTLTGAGTTWTSAMTSAWIVFPTGSGYVPTQVDAFISGTLFTVSVSQTIAAGTLYTLFYGGVLGISGNTAIGANALFSNTTASNLTAVGFGALLNSTGTQVTAVGYNTLTNNLGGNNNTAFGYSAGQTITTGSDNTLIGNAAQAFTTATQCTIIGSTGTVTGAASGTVVIGYGATSSIVNGIAIGSMANSSSTTNSLALQLNSNSITTASGGGLQLGININNTNYQIPLLTNSGMSKFYPYTTTVTASGTTTMTNASTFYQFWTGTLTQTILLPSTSTINTGTTYVIYNLSTGALTLQTNNTSALFILYTNSYATCVCINTGSDASVSWQCDVIGSNNRITMGQGANSGSTNGIAIGPGTKVSSTNGIGIGNTVLTGTGTDMLIIGNNAGSITSTGANNIGLGSNVLSSNTSGSGNTIIGFQSLRFNTTGIDNNAHGRASLQNNTTGSNNSAFGAITLFINTIGSNNSAFGNQTLRSNSVGNTNSAMGSVTLFNNTSGNNNSAFGYQALNNSGLLTYSAGTASQSTTTITGISTIWTAAMVGGVIVWGANTAQAPITTFVSTTSLTSTTSQTVSPASSYVIYFGPSIYTTGTVTGSGITLTGTGTTWTSAMTSAWIVFPAGSGYVPTQITSFNSTTSFTVSVSQTIAAGTLYTLFYGGTSSISGNTAIGANALFLNTVASNLTAVGFGALQNSNGTQLTAVGYNSLNANLAGTNNTALGYTSGNTITTGSDNTLIGNAAQAFAAASQCTVVGSTATVTSTAAGTTVVGYAATSSVANATAIGNSVSNAIANSVLLGQNAVPLARFEVPGTVTQLISLTTSVVINAAQGQITMFSTLGITSKARFTVSNNRVQASSVINATVQAVGTSSGFPTSVGIMSVGATTFDIIVYNPDPGATTAAPIIHFQILYPVL